MNSISLKNPIIVYWDLDSSLLDDDIVDSVCEGLIKNKIFVLHLKDTSTPLSRATSGILSRLAKENIRLILTVEELLLEPSTVKMMTDYGLKCFYVGIGSSEEFENALGDIMTGLKGGCPMGISFNMNKKSFREVPDVISLCLKHNVKNLQFPIQRADDKNIFYPNPEDARWIAEELKGVPLESIDISIHDPFIWTLLHGRDNPNEEGCNGAGTMIYISRNLFVTPCPILPVAIGNLRSSTLSDIFSSEKRQEVRKLLSRTPRECGNCSKLDICKGGCRGRAYVLSGSFDKQDPACTFLNTPEEV